MIKMLIDIIENKQTTNDDVKDAELILNSYERE
jgi:hypothetical protein